MQFSKNDLDIILKYVVERLFKHKLSDYPEPDSITGDEIMPIVQNEANKTLVLNDLIHVRSIVEAFAASDAKVTDFWDKIQLQLEEIHNQIDSFD
jgi:hypothetical protein